MIKINNKILSILTGILTVIVSIVVLMVGNYQNQVQQAEKAFTLNNNFYSFQMPKLDRSSSEYSKTIKNLNWTAQKTGINYLKRQRYLGWDKVKNRLDYNKPVQKVEFQVYTVKPTNLLKNFGKNSALISKSMEVSNYHLSGYSVYIVPIKNTVNDSRYREGTFFLETGNSKKTKTFLSLLASRLNEQNDQDVHLSDFKINDRDSIATVSYTHLTLPTILLV